MPRLFKKRRLEFSLVKFEYVPGILYDTSRVTHHAYGFYFHFLKHTQNQEVEKESVQTKTRCKITALLVKKVSIRELHSEITTKTTSFAVNYTPLHFFFILKYGT